MRARACALRGSCALATATLCLALWGCGGSSSGSGATPVSYEPIQYLPGGRHVLATRSVRGVGRVSIVAKRYLFQRHVYLDVDYEFESQNGAGSGSGVRDEGHAPLSWTFGGYCPASAAHATDVVVGMLRARGGAVFASTRGRMVRLWTARVPDYLLASGVAVYTVLPEPPESIVVRDAGGRTVMSQSLGRLGPTSCSGPGNGGEIVYGG